MLWSAIARIGTQGATLGTTAVVARLVAPEAYGLVGMAQLLMGLLVLLRDLGTASALVQRKELNEELLSSVFWLNVLLSSFGAAAAWIAAPFAAAVFHSPEVTSIVRALSLSIILTGISAVHGALLLRRMNFRAIAIAEITGAAAGGVLAITLAFWGAGVWSLVASAVANAVLSSILLIAAASWRPSLMLRADRLKAVARFSLNLTGFNLVNHAARNVDNALIAHFLGASQLAFYSIAYTLMLFPVQNIAQLLTRVLFPALSELQDDEQRFRSTYLRACAAIALVTFPMMVGLALLARPFVLVVLGYGWLPAVPVITVLAPVGMAQSIMTTTGQIYTAKGRTDLLLRWGLIASTVFVAGFALGLPWGIVGVASSYAITTALLIVPVFVVPFRLAGITLGALWAAVWPALKCSAAMLAVVAVARQFTAGMGPLPQLLLCTLVGAAVYAAAVLWTSPPALHDLLHALHIRRRSNPFRPGELHGEAR